MPGKTSKSPLGDRTNVRARSKTNGRHARAASLGAWEQAAAEQLEAARAKGRTAAKAAAAQLAERDRAIAELTAQLAVQARALAAALLAAAAEGPPEIALALVKAGAGTGAVNERGDTPLLLAIGKARTALAVALLAAGADPNAANEAGATPLLCSIQNGNAEVTRALLEAGGKPGAADETGTTPLLAASVQFLHANSTGVAKQLLAERRVAENGGVYTRAHFEEHYGGLSEWDAAAGSSTCAEYVSPLRQPTPCPPNPVLCDRARTH